MFVNTRSRDKKKRNIIRPRCSCGCDNAHETTPKHPQKNSNAIQAKINRSSSFKEKAKTKTRAKNKNPNKREKKSEEKAAKTSQVSAGKSKKECVVLLIRSPELFPVNKTFSKDESNEFADNKSEKSVVVLRESPRHNVKNVDEETEKTVAGKRLSNRNRRKGKENNNNACEQGFKSMGELKPSLKKIKNCLEPSKNFASESSREIQEVCEQEQNNELKPTRELRPLLKRIDFNQQPTKNTAADSIKEVCEQEQNYGLKPTRELRPVLKRIQINQQPTRLHLKPKFRKIGDNKQPTTKIAPVPPKTDEPEPIKPNQKNTKVEPKNPTPVSKLRKRKYFDYAESSLEVTKTETEIENKKIPVYKRHLDEEPGKLKNQEDQYEFNSDSEKQKKRKRRRLDSDASFGEYDKTIQNILKNIANRVKNRKKKVIYSDKNKAVKTTKAIRGQNELKENEKPVQKPSQIEIAQKTIEERVSPVESSDDVGDCFGFSNPDCPKIKIISDILLSPSDKFDVSISSPRQFENCRPNANSTMLNVLTPWRFNEINIRRNPHFLELKQSSLPRMNQEMVLDHTMVDNFGVVSKLEENLPKTKTSVQKTLTEYFDTTVEDKENRADSSIFDIDQWSPMKSPRNSNRVDSVKRKILGERDNNLKASTPKKNQENEERENESSVFGFGSWEEETEERIQEEKNKEDKPFRVSINTKDKKYVKKQRVVKNEKAESVASDGEENDVSDLEDLEIHDTEIKLFEDYPEPRIDIEDDTNARKKRSKKQRWMEQSPKYTKKRKDIRTAAEEKEAEKWAASFNSMCEEIDNFALEIE